MIVCFHCGGANSSGSENCHVCGQPLPQGEGGEPEVYEPVEHGKVDRFCLQCGTKLGESDQYCPECQAKVLPVDQGPPTANFKEELGLYKKCELAVNRVKLGEWDPKRALNFFDETTVVIEKQLDEIFQLIQESNYYEHNAKEVDLGLSGLYGILEGLMIMRLFIEDGQMSHLENGLSKIWSSNQEINQSLRSNREYVHDLKEEWGYI